MNIRDWQAASGAVARSKGFKTKAGDVHRSLLMIVGEVCEAQNELRMGHPETEIYYNLDAEDPNKPEGMPVELADAVLRIMNLADDLGIDLQTAMQIKHAFNVTRKDMHGGKLF